MSLILKDPDAALDYEVDWGDIYLGDDRIASSFWTVLPGGDGAPTIELDEHDGRVARVSIAGGRAGHVYRLSNQMVTEGGLQDRRSFMVRVEKR